MVSEMKKRTPSRDKCSEAVQCKKQKTSASVEDNKVKEMDNKILGVMFRFHQDEKFDVTVELVAHHLGYQVRTKSFRSRWTVLKNEKKWIEGDNGKFKLSQIGIDQAATPEYKAKLKELAIKPKTNADYQARIKKWFQKKKSAEMFDFFLEYGSLTRYELESLTKQNRRSHVASYSWQELRRGGYVEDEGAKNGTEKTFRLSDKAFLNPKDDRPKYHDDVQKKLKECVASGRAVIDERKRGSSNPKKSKSTKHSEVKCEIRINTEGERLKDCIEDMKKENAKETAKSKNVAKPDEIESNGKLDMADIDSSKCAKNAREKQREEFKDKDKDKDKNDKNHNEKGEMSTRDEHKGRDKHDKTFKNKEKNNGCSTSKTSDNILKNSTNDKEKDIHVRTQPSEDCVSSKSAKDALDTAKVLNTERLDTNSEKRKGVAFIDVEDGEILETTSMAVTKKKGDLSSFVGIKNGNERWINSFGMPMNN